MLAIAFSDASLKIRSCTAAGELSLKLCRGVASVRNLSISKIQGRVGGSYQVWCPSSSVPSISRGELVEDELLMVLSTQVGQI